MTRDKFLPQYAAQAVDDIETAVKRGKARPDIISGSMLNAWTSVANSIRQAVHVVLPPNGEIYRVNDDGGGIPSDDERDSFIGLPAPVTCFEYAWTHRPKELQRVGDAIGTKRITLAFDSKQIDGYTDKPHLTSLISVFYDESARIWAIGPCVMKVPQPLLTEMAPHPEDHTHWAIRCALAKIEAPSDLSGHELESHSHIVGQFRPDLTALIQCCHALRAGATLEERTEQFTTRRWKFEKRGVGGFTYHVLKLPERALSPRADVSGTHSSPRLHVRRAHIRKLPTGVLTFVRQCFVGDPERGVVDKHYKVDRPHDQASQ